MSRQRKLVGCPKNMDENGRYIDMRKVRGDIEIPNPVHISRRWDITNLP
jgi:hypothetical protein